MQELIGDAAVILNDLVDFLESLSNVELPETVQTARDTLLLRARMTLRQSFHTLNSPQPYLDMKASKNMMLLMNDEDEQSSEYISADEQQIKEGSFQHYYETFQYFQEEDSKRKFFEKTQKNVDINNIVLMYEGFSALQAKNRSVKSGLLLHLKRERRMFSPFKVFWLNRWCWVSLLGSHLLLYVNERESRPYLVIPLSGYKSRPAPEAIVRDPRRSQAAFEIYCPGDRTFQFVAKSIQDMRQWVDVISNNFQLDDKFRIESKTKSLKKKLDLESNEHMCLDRAQQDVLSSSKCTVNLKQKSTINTAINEKNKVNCEGEAPPLPARTRRLPLLPLKERILYENQEEPYDEEGLYHRIEDIRAHKEYQNFQIPTSSIKKEQKVILSNSFVQEMYDDVEAILKGSKKILEEPLENYDGIQDIVKGKDETKSYDNFQFKTDNLQVQLDIGKNSSKSTKSSQKRSFFYRVCNRKESMKKDEKTVKFPMPSISASLMKIPSLMKSNKAELTCGDDNSNLPPKDTYTFSSEINEEDYQLPPPPRPLYSRVPIIIKCAMSNEVYDDIGSSIQAITNTCKDSANFDFSQDNLNNTAYIRNLQLNISQEYYQVPKSINYMIDKYQEELYDDVAVSETFKNRQRNSTVSYSS